MVSTWTRNHVPKPPKGAQKSSTFDTVISSGMSHTYLQLNSPELAEDLDSSRSAARMRGSLRLPKCRGYSFICLLRPKPIAHSYPDPRGQVRLMDSLPDHQVRPPDYRRGWKQSLPEGSRVAGKTGRCRAESLFVVFEGLAHVRFWTRCGSKLQAQGSVVSIWLGVRIWDQRTKVLREPNLLKQKGIPAAGLLSRSGHSVSFRTCLLWGTWTMKVV